MSSRFFPRYNLKNDIIDAYFLGNDHSVLPDIFQVLDASLSGLKLRVKNWNPHFNGAKIGIRYKNHNLYFQTRVIWNEKLTDNEFFVGLKLIIPTSDTFDKWLMIIQEIDQGHILDLEKNRNSRNLPTKDLKGHHASSY